MKGTLVCKGFTVVRHETAKDGKGKDVAVSRRYHAREAAEKFLMLAKAIAPGSDLRVREDAGYDYV